MNREKWGLKKGMPFSQDQTVSGRADNETKASKNSVQGSTDSFLNPGIQLCYCSKSFGGHILMALLNLERWSWYSSLRHTHSLHVSPLEFRFEHGFILAGARETHFASARRSAWVLWSSDSAGKHLPNPHGFLHIFFSYSSNFWMQEMPKSRGLETQRFSFDHGWRKASLWAFSDFLFRKLQSSR